MTYRLVPLPDGFYDLSADEGAVPIKDDLYYLLSADAAVLDPWCRSQVIVEPVEPEPVP